MNDLQIHPKHSLLIYGNMIFPMIFASLPLLIWNMRALLAGLHASSWLENRNCVIYICCWVFKMGSLLYKVPPPPPPKNHPTPQKNSPHVKKKSHQQKITKKAKKKKKKGTKNQLPRSIPQHYPTLPLPRPKPKLKNPQQKEAKKPSKIVLCSGFILLLVLIHMVCSAEVCTRVIQDRMT